MLTISVQADRLVLADAAGREVLTAELQCDSAEAQGLVALARGDDGRLRGRHGSLAIEVAAASVGASFAELTLRLAPSQPVRVEQLGLALKLTERGRSFLAPSTRLMALGESLGGGRRVAELGAMLQAADGPVTVHAIGALLHGGTEALLVGIGGVVPDFPSFTTDGESAQFALNLERTLPRPVEYTVVLGLSGDAHALLEGYGDLLARGGRPVGEVPTGWNSWDYYQGAVTMDDIRAEMAAINASPLRGRLKYVTLDMGWENCWGDWRPNRKFPESPADIAREIRAAGFEPGIWLAPLQASTYLPRLRHERDMLCRQPDGEPIIASGNGSCTLLDPTHPQTEAWLHDTCHGLREAGFSLFKVDYIYRNYLDTMGEFHEPGTGKAAVARRFLEIIRGAIGEDAHLLSCGVPLPAAFGLADSARISVDIHNFWGHVRNSAGQVAAAYWLNRRVWVNDPDFALIRCPQTSDDPHLNVPYGRRPYASPEDYWMAGDDASFAELKTWLTLVHLCGGSVFASDCTPRLNALGVSTLARLLEEPSDPARPLDLFENTPPRIWLADKRLGLINYDDEPAEIALPAGAPDEGVDFWSGEQVKLGATVCLPAHGSLLLKV
jgi:hypothetical protein